MTMECFKTVGAERLLQLADLLDEVDAIHVANGEPVYDQGAWQHECGTPACAMGHYAASEISEGRWSLGIKKGGGIRLLAKPSGQTTIEDIAAEFCIDNFERMELFGAHGCGRALNGKTAAAYIRRFVERKLICAVPNNAGEENHV